MAGIKYEIEKKIGVISENDKGWMKQLNVVSWNDRPAKYDIREWSPDEKKMGKGLTFTQEELVNLRNVLNDLDLD